MVPEVFCNGIQHTNAVKATLKNEQKKSPADNGIKQDISKR